MFFKQLGAKKTLEQLAAEAAGENRLRRILGPVGLTSLGIGAIIGAGIFVMTGRAAAQDAGPAIMLSYVVAGIGCLFAALCYAEFASTTPVAGSAYTYAYATLGEGFAWFIGWDLVLEYAMACAVVAAGWSSYLNKLLKAFKLEEIPAYLCTEPFSHPEDGNLLNLPAILIVLACTVILVIGIRESATMNAILVLIKLGVVVFVIVAGWWYVNRDNWTEIPVERRLTAEGRFVGPLTEQFLLGKKKESELTEAEKNTLAADKNVVSGQTLALYYVRRENKVRGTEPSQEEIQKLLATIPTRTGIVLELPKTPADKERADKVLASLDARLEQNRTEKWGVLGWLGIDQSLAKIDDSARSNFMPYGISGIMLGAAIVFFAYIGFDAISTHSEEAKNPSRDLPIAILLSLVVCTILYIGVAGTITGMVEYPDIDPRGAVAEAFLQRGDNLAGALIAIGALAGLTSVLLITFLSQARIFLAMSRDGLLPQNIFAAIHEKFRTPHRSTILTGLIIALVAGFTPIEELELMVNIGTLAAFVVVCAAVLLLRIQRPDAYRPFRCPLVFIVAPLGILVNLTMMLFLPPITWARLLGWLLIGLVIYFSFGFWNSIVGRRLRGEKVDQINIPKFGHGH